MNFKSQAGTLIVLSISFVACGTRIGPSIRDRGAHVQYSSIIIPRALAGQLTPTSSAASHGVIPPRSAFALENCILPTGLSFNSDTGVITGIPLNVQSAVPCSVRLTDSLGSTFLSKFQITISDLWSDGSNSLAGLQQGAMSSMTWDSANSVLRLVTSSNQSSLDSTWAPQWTHVKGYWRMDNDWSDSSGNNNHGAVAGGTPTFTSSSKVGPAAGNFNGASYVSVPSSSSLNFTAQMTVMTWIYISSSTQNFWLFSKNAPGFGTGFGIAFEHPTGKVWPHLGIGGGLRNPKSLGATAYGQWNHVVVTYDGATIKVYLNGVLDSTLAQSGAIGTNSSPLYFGNSPGSPGEYLNGKIDELAIWDIALTQAEIEEVYARQLPQFSGNFTSRIFDNLSVTSWPGIRWTSSLPFGKELPGDFDQNHVITAADSETTDSYPNLISNLMAGLQGLWHFNESSAGTGGTGNDLRDASGSGLWLNGHGTLNYGNTGRFGSAVKFDGSSSYASASDSTMPSGTSSRTISIWVNPGALPSSNQTATLVSWGANATSQGYGIAIHNSGGTQNINHFGMYNDFEVPYTTPLYVWTHLVATYDGTTARTYINGNLVGSQAKSWNTLLGGVFSIGRHFIGSLYFNGSLDELAIWNRALSQAEIIQLYRRGANRLRIQVRTCVDALCNTSSDWLGPDGTSLTYFDETYNSLSNTYLGSPLLSGPNMLFSHFGTPLDTNLIDSQYFQYRVLMESDDANNLCDYGSGPAGCTPELQSVVSGPSY